MRVSLRKLITLGGKSSLVFFKIWFQIGIWEVQVKATVVEPDPKGVTSYLGNVTAARQGE